MFEDASYRRQKAQPDHFTFNYTSNFSLEELQRYMQEKGFEGVELQSHWGVTHAKGYLKGNKVTIHFNSGLFDKGVSNGVRVNVKPEFSDAWDVGTTVRQLFTKFREPERVEIPVRNRIFIDYSY